MMFEQIQINFVAEVTNRGNKCHHNVLEKVVKVIVYTNIQKYSLYVYIYSPHETGSK